MRFSAIQGLSETKRNSLDASEKEKSFCDLGRVRVKASLRFLSLCGPVLQFQENIIDLNFLPHIRTNRKSFV